MLAGRNPPQGYLLGTGSGRSISTFCTLARDSPEIHRRVRTPRPPSFGVTLQFTRTPKRHGVQKTKIARWERVGLPKRSHSHILCRPFPDAWSFAHSPSESPDCLRSSPGESDPGKLRVGKRRRCGEKMSQAIA